MGIDSQLPLSFLAMHKWPVAAVFVCAFLLLALHYTLLYPPPPLQSPGVARDGLPGGGGGRSPSDGVPGGGGRVQGYLKANCGTLH